MGSPWSLNTKVCLISCAQHLLLQGEKGIIPEFHSAALIPLNLVTFHRYLGWRPSLVDKMKKKRKKAVETVFGIL